MTNYKLWTTLTEPILLKGIPLEYGVSLVVGSSLIYTFSLSNYYLAGSFIVIGYVIGVCITRLDQSWFAVLIQNLLNFGVKSFKRWRYVA